MGIGRAVKGFMAEKLGLGLYSLMKKQKLSRNLHLLGEAWHWPAARVREYQVGRLAQLLSHAYTNHPFYRSRMDRANLSPDRFRNIDQLKVLPVLARDDMEALFDSVRTSSADLTLCFTGSSSGTTGIPARYFKDPSTMGMERSAMLFGRIRNGWTPGDPTAVVWGNPKTVETLWRRPSSKLMTFLMNEHRVAACYLNSNERVDTALDDLIRWRPAYVYGYTNSLRILAARLLERNLELNCRKVFTTAETMLEGSREVIQKAMGPVSDSYGCSEINGIAFQCGSCGKYHVADPHVVVEYEPVPDGGGYSILVTDLDNYIMPLIRYRVGDIVIPSKDLEPCPSGNRWNRIESIQGRISDVIRIGSSYVNPITYFGDSLGRLITGMTGRSIPYQTVWNGESFTTTLFCGENELKGILPDLGSEMNRRLRGLGVSHLFRIEEHASPRAKAGKLAFFLNESGER